MKHQHYYREWHGKLDIYRILALYQVDDPCIQHAVKKLLCTGERGHKDFRTDIENVIDTLNRKLEMLEEDQQALPEEIKSVRSGEEVLRLRKKYGSVGLTNREII